MFDDFLVPLMVTTGTAAIAFSVREARALRRRGRALNIVLQTAMLDAARRRHATATPDHVLRTVLDIPEVATEWIARGWPLAALLRTLDARLDAQAAGGGDSTWQAGMSPDLATVLRKAAVTAARSRIPPARAGQAMLLAIHGELLDREPLVVQLFLEHGALLSPLTFSREGAARATSQTTQEESPYRSANAEPVANVVFWNDRRTTMKAVVDILTNIFGMSETRATYLMLTVHYEGRAVVWSSRRAHAQALASRATLVARERGMPLHVTTEL
jgi:ATP-dependent Clp protease adaptor protein ClpS